MVDEREITDYDVDDTAGLLWEYGETVVFEADGESAVSNLDDTQQYWRSDSPASSVKNPDTNTQIRVKSVSAKGTFMQVEVKPVK